MGIHTLIKVALQRAIHCNPTQLTTERLCKCSWRTVFAGRIETVPDLCRLSFAAQSATRRSRERRASCSINVRALTLNCKRVVGVGASREPRNEPSTSAALATHLSSALIAIPGTHIAPTVRYIAPCLRERSSSYPNCALMLTSAAQCPQAVWIGSGARKSRKRVRDMPPHIRDRLAIARAFNEVPQEGAYGLLRLSS